MHQQGSDSTRFGHYEQKRIPVRYAAKEKMVLVPVSPTQYRLIAGAITISWWLMLFFFAYFLLGLPVQILINIAKGNAFTPQNIRRFQLIACSMVALPLVAMTVSHVLHLLLRSRIPSDFQLQSFWEGIPAYFSSILAAAALFIVGKAFERGYKLQQEQDLTI